MVLNSLNGSGFKLPDEVEDQLEVYVRQSADNELPRPTGAGIGRVEYNSNLAHHYGLTLFVIQSIHPLKV